MRGLYPLLGADRRSQIDRALTAPVAALRWRRPAQRCATAQYRRPGAVRGLCSHHYKLWWKSYRRGRRSRYRPVDAAPPMTVSHPHDGSAPTRDRLWMAWLAGLLEGEGTFTSNATYPVVKLQMCDLDIVQRAATITGIDRIWPRDSERHRVHGWSPSFEIAVGGARAADLMRELRPMMGQRRTAAIDHALAQYRPIRLLAVPDQCVVPDCHAYPRGRGLCHRHYMTWDRDRKAGKPQRITPLR